MLRSRTKKIAPILSNNYSSQTLFEENKMEIDDSDEESKVASFLFGNDRIILRRIQGAKPSTLSQVLPPQSEGGPGLNPELDSIALPLKRTFKGAGLFSNEL